MSKHNNNAISIIVIDDNEEIADNLSDYLAKKGYSSKKAFTGQQGIELINTQHPHIAIVDLKLPDINGIELLKLIKANSPETIIILISGYATIDAAAESIQHGAFDFIAKPFNYEELERILHRAIKNKNQTKKSQQHKKRNMIWSLTIPLCLLLGYLLFRFLK